MLSRRLLSPLTMLVSITKLDRLVRGSTSIASRPTESASSFDNSPVNMPNGPLAFLSHASAAPHVSQSPSGGQVRREMPTSISRCTGRNGVTPSRTWTGPSGLLITTLKSSARAAWKGFTRLDSSAPSASQHRGCANARMHSCSIRSSRSLRTPHGSTTSESCRVPDRR